MPLTSPAFPPGPYRFINREYLIITYRTDPAALDSVVPEPLTWEEPLAKYEFIRMPDSTGFGDYTESGQVIPVRFNGQEGGYCALAPIAALPVREIMSATHIIADLTLGLGKVVYNYLKD
jgi:acetoacetate decarboxylase